MTCRQFRHLRDAYLDGGLSESQVAEMHAHLLQCPECQRELEMLRACGDVIARDRCGPRPSAGFTDRVMAALPSHQVAVSPDHRRRLRARKWLEYGAAPAVAAALALFVILVPPTRVFQPPAGPFSPADAGGQGRVLGDSVTITDAVFGGRELDETISSLNEWGRAAERFKGLCARTLEEARDDLARETTGAGVRPDRGAQEPSFVEELLRPFIDLFDPPLSAPPTPDDVQRF